METFKNTVYRNSDNTAKTIMSGISETEIGPPAKYGGSADTLNPEELFVASINSCLMLVFYHFVKKLNVDITSYSATAQGLVEKTADGLRFTKVTVKAEVTVGNSSAAEKIGELRDLAEKYCLVSNSVKCPIEYEVSISESR